MQWHQLDHIQTVCTLLPTGNYASTSSLNFYWLDALLDAFELKGLRRILRVLWTAKKTNEWVLNKAGVKRELLDSVKARSHHEETRELPGERHNARNNARCTKARKATHGLDGQHQDVDRILRGRVNQNDRTGINGESTSMVWPTLGSKTAEEQNRTVS